MLKVFANFLRFNFIFGIVLNLLWLNIDYDHRQNFIIENGRILQNKPAILSHCHRHQSGGVIFNSDEFVRSLTKSCTISPCRVKNRRDRDDDDDDDAEGSTEKDFFNWPSSASFSIIFLFFSNKQFKIYSKWTWWHVHPVSGAGIPTHDIVKSVFSNYHWTRAPAL